MTKILLNKKGGAFLSVLILFFFVSSIMIWIISDQLSFLKINNIIYEKDKSMLFSKSGLEIAMAEIENNNYPLQIIIKEAGGSISLSIIYIDNDLFTIKSEGSHGQSKSIVNATVIKDTNDQIKVLERSIR